MDKAPDALRTISEVSEAIAIPAHVLRFWESRFPQIKPVKRAGGRRYYRPSDIALVCGIRQLLHKDGMTIRAVQDLLREKGVRHVATLGGANAADLDLAEAAAMKPVVGPPTPASAQILPLSVPPVTATSDRPKAPDQTAIVHSLFPADVAEQPINFANPARRTKPRPPVLRPVAAGQPDQPRLPLILEPQAPEAPHIWLEDDLPARADVVPLYPGAPAAQALAQMAAQLQPLSAPAQAQSAATLRDLHRRLSQLHAQMAQPARPKR